MRVDAKLAVGGVAEQVTVRSGAPLINTETPTVAGKVDNRELQQLPFTFRTQNTSPIPAIQAIPEVQRVGAAVLALRRASVSDRGLGRRHL